MGMIIRFSASNIVAMILFIPLLLVLGVIMAFLVPLFALIIAAASILFLGLYTFAKIGLVRKQQIRISRDTGDGSRGKKGTIKDVKEYKVR